MNNRKQDKNPLFAEVELTGDEFKQAPYNGRQQMLVNVPAMMYSFFDACRVKGKNPERWLAYVLDHIKDTKEGDLYQLLPEFWEANK